MSKAARDLRVVTGAEYKRLMRTCSDCDCDFLAVPWQFVCNTCHPRVSGKEYKKEKVVYEPIEPTGVHYKKRKAQDEFLESKGL